jgi:hypothetical protein
MLSWDTSHSRQICNPIIILPVTITQATRRNSLMEAIAVVTASQTLLIAAAGSHRALAAQAAEKEQTSQEQICALPS